MSPELQVSAATRDQIQLLSRAWSVSEDTVLVRLLDTFKGKGSEDGGTAPTATPGAVPIHAVYEGERIEAEFYPESGAVTITSGSLAGKRYRTPSGAARDVVVDLNPKVNGNRNGWGFWVVTATGEWLQSIRRS